VCYVFVCVRTGVGAGVYVCGVCVCGVESNVPRLEVSKRTSFKQKLENRSFNSKCFAI